MASAWDGFERCECYSWFLFGFIVFFLNGFYGFYWFYGFLLVFVSWFCFSGDFPAFMALF